MEWSGLGLDAMIVVAMPMFRAVSEFYLTTLAILPQFLDCLFRLMLDS